MDRKSYAQACTVAAALDLVGDRWTLLLLRELLGGPARFGELHAGLPGIAKNLLATRLRTLEADGLVRKLGASGVTLYALTEHGAGVRPIIDQLGAWGARASRIAPVAHGRSPRALAVALQAILSRPGRALPPEPKLLELEVEGAPLEILLGAPPRVTVRPVHAADAHVRASAGTLAGYLAGEGFPGERLELVSGDGAAARALLDALVGTP